MESRWTAAVVGVVVALLGLAVWQIVAEKQTPRDQQTSSVGEAASFPNQTGGKLSASPTNPMTAPAPRDAASTSKPTPSSIAPPPFAPPDEAAMIEVDKVSLMIRDYRTIADENPVGTNAEIMAAVMGGNRRQAKLGPPEGMQLNEKGELIDRWGTPYFFHQLSRNEMEIRSAGADKIMWTDDDAVTK